MAEIARLTARQVVPRGRLEKGFLKARLIHFDFATVIQPDVVMSSAFAGSSFYIPQYYWAPRLAFFTEEDDSDYCQFAIALSNGDAVRNGTEIVVTFFRRDLVKTCLDGSQIYHCWFADVEGTTERPPPDGIYRREGDSFQLRLFHHTTPEGENGISESQELWSSRKRIKGDTKVLLQNIAYGYFTNLERIQSQQDLERIAMSESGIAAFLPINAEAHPRNAIAIEVPRENTAGRAVSLPFWIDIEDLAPNHLWIKRPMGRPVYYEVVLPNVMRVGVNVDATLPFDADNVIRLRPEDRKGFNYVVLGDGDTHEGLVAPYFEEEALNVGKIEKMSEEVDFFGFWKANANSDLFSSKIVENAEIAQLASEDDEGMDGTGSVGGGSNSRPNAY